MFASCKKLLSENSCASLVPLGMKWACVCAGKKCAWCDVVCGEKMTVPQEKDDICNRPQITPEGIYLLYGFN